MQDFAVAFDVDVVVDDDDVFEERIGDEGRHRRRLGLADALSQGQDFRKGRKDRGEVGVRPGRPPHGFARVRCLGYRFDQIRRYGCGVNPAAPHFPQLAVCHASSPS